MNRGPTILIGLLLATSIATSQKAEDVGELKVGAERGDAPAQIKLANAYLNNSRPNDARRWYEAAAQQNSAEGQFQLGNLLLTGRTSAMPDQSLLADPTGALRWIYSAATNGHKGAWRSLAVCLQTGSNCATNLPEAYAWLTLLADAGDTAGRNEMNRLALDLSSPDIQAGKSVFAAMKAGQWPAPPAAENSRIGPWLRLQGVAISPKAKLVIIGNRTLAEGEQTYLSVDGKFIRVTCLNIDSNSVQVQVEGEAKPRLLRNSFGDSATEERK
jgi:TPR repeat protein